MNEYYKSPSTLYKLPRSEAGEKAFQARQAKINQEKERQRQLKELGDKLINEEIDRLVKSMEKQQIIMENLQKGVNSMVNILNSSKKTLAKSKNLIKNTLTKSKSSKKTLAKSSSDILKYYR